MLGCLPRDGLLVISAEIARPFVRFGENYFLFWRCGENIRITLEVPETAAAPSVSQ